MQANSLQESYGNPHRHHGRSPRRHKGQWNSGDGHDAQRHANVFKHLKCQPGQDSRSHESAVAVVGTPRGHGGAPQDHTEKSNDDQ